MKSWINVEARFDLPMISFQISLRQLAAGGWMRGLRDTENDPERIAKVLYDYILTKRRNLVGMTIVTMGFGYGGMWLDVVVIHPSFPRQPWFERVPVVMLDPCAVCGKDIPAESGYVTAVNMVGDKDKTAFCCNTTCMAAYRPKVPLAEQKISEPDEIPWEGIRWGKEVKPISSEEEAAIDQEVNKTIRNGFERSRMKIREAVQKITEKIEEDIIGKSDVEYRPKDAPAGNCWICDKHIPENAAFRAIHEMVRSDMLVTLICSPECNAKLMK